MIDTHPGLNEETLLSIAISDALGIINCAPTTRTTRAPASTVEVARKLDVPRMLLIVNKVPAVFEPGRRQDPRRADLSLRSRRRLPSLRGDDGLASAGIFGPTLPRPPYHRHPQQLAARLWHNMA